MINPRMGYIFALTSFLFACIFFLCAGSVSYQFGPVRSRLPDVYSIMQTQRWITTWVGIFLILCAIASLTAGISNKSELVWVGLVMKALLMCCCFPLAIWVKGSMVAAACVAYCLEVIVEGVIIFVHISKWQRKERRINKFCHDTYVGFPTGPVRRPMPPVPRAQALRAPSFQTNVHYNGQFVGSYGTTFHTQTVGSPCII